MTDQQNEAHEWLSDYEDIKMKEIRALEERQSKLLSQGVGNYDAEKIRGGSDPNPSESKMIEYSLITKQIEEKKHEIAYKSAQKLQVINKVKNPLHRLFLIERYINQKYSWEQVGRIHNYEKSQANTIGRDALDAVYPFVKEAKYG